MVAGFIAALTRAQTDDDVRVIVLDGAGDHFCGGADIVARNREQETRPRAGGIQRRLPTQAHRLIPMLTEVQVPVVCKVRGWAAGIGFSLALASDFAVAAADATFWEPFTERGFTPDSGATWLLPRRVGVVRARELLLLGRKLSGAEAAEWGVVRAAVPAGDLDGAVAELVDAARVGTDGGPRAREVAAPRGERRGARRASRQRGVRARAVVSHRRLPRGHGRVPRAPRTRLPRPMTVTETRLPVGPDSTDAEVVAAVRAWIEANVPGPWIDAGRRGGALALREVRTRADYEAWYPVFARFGAGRAHLAGRVRGSRPAGRRGAARGAGAARRSTSAASTRSASTSPRPRCSRTAPRSSACASCRRSCATRRCGASSSASRARAPISRRSPRPRPETATSGVVTGQKVWTTWAHLADYGVLLARTDPDAAKRHGITYFLIDLHQLGVEVRPLRHIGGEVDFNEVFLDAAVVPDSQRVGAVGDGWKVANATLSGERQMVSGAGSGGVDRIGGRGVEHVLALARTRGRAGDPVVRQDLMRAYTEERVRDWTNQRVRAQVKAGRAPGPESSIGKVHQGGLNQRVQLLATELLGMDAIAWSPRR